MIFYFATWPAVEYQAKILTEGKANNRLLSYAFLKELPEGYLKNYAANGIGPDRKNK